MAFTLFFLRPALGVLEPPVRLRLMQDVLGRFFAAVLAGVALLLGEELRIDRDAVVRIRLGDRLR